MKKTNVLEVEKSPEITLMVDGQTIFSTTETPDKKLVYITIEDKGDSEQVQVSAIGISITHIETTIDGLVQAYALMLEQEFIESKVPEPIIRFAIIDRLGDVISRALNSNG